MMRCRWALVCLVVAMAVAGPGLAMAGAGNDASTEPVFEMEFTNAKMLPAHWLLKLNPDGSGRFDADGGDPLPEEGQTIVAVNVHRPIQLSTAFAEHVFATARQRKLFAMACESRLKVAFQGTKRLSYSGPDGSGDCEYNYSKDQVIQALGDSVMAVEATLLYGARLEKLLQHDRLGLDRELGNLTSDVHNGNAMEIGAIRATLTKIALDDGVLDRARRMARNLMSQNR